MTDRIVIDPVHPVSETIAIEWLEEQLVAAKYLLAHRRIVRYLFTDTVGNDGAAEKTLATVQMQPNKSSEFNIHIAGFGECAANANTKTIRLYYGTDVLFTKATTSEVLWSFNTIISVQSSPICMTVFHFDGTFDVIKLDMSEVFNAEKELKITGESDAASANDVTLRNFLVEESGYVATFAGSGL